MSITTAYIERFNSEQMMNSKVAVSKYYRSIDTLNSEEKKNEILRLFQSKEKEDIRLNFHIQNIIGLFNELGVAFRAGIIDRKVLFYFNRIVPEYWNTFSDYILLFRESVKPNNVFTSFEYLKNYLEQNPFWIEGELNM